MKAIILLIFFIVFSMSAGVLAGAGAFAVLEPIIAERMDQSVEFAAVVSIAAGVSTWGTMIVVYLKA